jgi:hypothetical protein
MYAHVEDQMAAVNEEIQLLKKKLLALEKKKQEAIANGKITLAQKFMIEVCPKSLDLSLCLVISRVDPRKELLEEILNKRKMK